MFTQEPQVFFHIIWSFSTQIFERFGALDLRCMLVLEYIWIFEYPQVFFAGYLDIWRLGAVLPRGQSGGKNWQFAKSAATEGARNRPT